MSKILFFNVAAFGHVNPTIPIAKELQRQGHEVLYINYESMKDIIVREGIPFLSYESLSNESLCSYKEKNFLSRAVKSIRTVTDNKNERKELIKTISKAYNSYHTLELALLTIDSIEYLEPVSELLLREKPQCIFVDNMCPWPRMAASINNIPVVSSVVCLMNFQQLHYTGFQTEEYMELNRSIDLILFNLKKRYGLNEEYFERELYRISPQKAIVYNSKLLQNNHNEFDKNCFEFVGASIDRRNETLSDEILEKLRSYQGKKIFISFGTVNNHLSFFKMVIEALKDKPYLVVMSVGKLSIEDLGEIPSNFIVYPYVPQLEVLKYVDLVVCHGGANTVIEALYYGIPLWILPLVNDQPVWAYWVEDVKAGIKSDIKTITKDKISKNIEELLSNKKFITHALKVSNSLIEAGGAKKAAKILSTVAQQG